MRGPQPTIALFKCTTDAVMYIRFTIPSDGERVPHRTFPGIFRATRRLMDADRFNRWQDDVLNEEFA